MRLKKINYFDTAICIIYLASIGYFLFNKDYKNAALPTVAFIIGSLFILFCLVFGSSFRLYDSIKHYDDFLHFWSGFITVKIGFNIIKTIEISNFNSKLLVIILLFFFAMGFASICEIVEYSLDTIFKMNTQQGGLTDTMNDMIDALFGSIIMIIYYIKKI